MLAWRHGHTSMTLWHAKHWLFTNLTNFARLGSALARHRAGLDLVGRNRGHTANVHAAHKEFKIYFLIPSKYVIAGYYIQQYTRDTGYMNWKYFYISHWQLCQPVRSEPANTKEIKMSQKDINWKIIGAQDVSGDQNQKLRETSHHCHTQHYQQAAIKTSKNTLEFLGRQNHSHVPFCVS